MLNAPLRKLVDLLRGMTRLESAILCVVVVVSALHLWTRLAESLAPKRPHADQQLQGAFGDSDNGGRLPN
jgi:hypothetical protein